MTTLRCLNDVNVVRLLGVVLGGRHHGDHHHGDASPSIITEYMLHGDLKQYLQRHRAQDSTTLARGSSAASLATTNTLRYRLTTATYMCKFLCDTQRVAVLPGNSSGHVF